jgi:hypothetical protein
MKRVQFIRWTVISAVALLLAGPASATIVVDAWYRGGEADPGAFNGGSISTTYDSVGGLNLTSVNNMTWSNATPPALGGFSGFSLDSGGYASKSGPVTLANQNVGIEVWVKADTTGGSGMIAYNGKWSLQNGFGIRQQSGNYFATFPGADNFGFTPVSTSWTELALVMKADGFSRFYVNGVLNATVGYLPLVPTANGTMDVGGLSATPFAFSGLIDEVRVFHFATGQFNPATDLLLAVTPEPTIVVLCGAGSLVLLWRKRSQK